MTLQNIQKKDISANTVTKYRQLFETNKEGSDEKILAYLLLICIFVESV